jgi:hypothetical protein
MRPYNDVRINKGTLLREFNSRVDDIEYTWHRDEDDRIIEVFSGAGWQLQLDNQLPVLLESGYEYHVPAGVWHRLHKGFDNLTVLISEGKKKADGKRSVKMGADNNPNVTRMDFLPDKVLKKIAKEKEANTKEEADSLEERKKRRKKKSKAKLTPGYKANRSQKSQDRLQSLIARYNKAKKTPGKKDDLAAIRARDNFEKKQYKSPKKSQYTENNEIDELINELAEEMAILEKKKKKKKKKGGSRKISSKVDKSLKKKAKDRNAPVGALKAIYRKGMGAFYSSGSRSGQNPHSWAMARVNSVLSGGKARSVDAAQWKQIQKHRKKKRKKK